MKNGVNQNENNINSNIKKNDSYIDISTTCKNFETATIRQAFFISGINKHQ